ncbi:MAG: CRISPR-associated endoribonuclease Cas6 [Caldilineales bacterium]|nr:CRISPR-associated endoribonuclease Cas6 [Caldilineales bacterium]MCW5858974.1 CRISPR-associated endoribonuclease Cas6 [Caldilineales bacterium]
MSPYPDHTLHAIVVNLMAAEDGFTPLTQGPLAQAAFLDLVQAADPDLAAHLHDDNQRKPYTISPLHNLPRADERGRHVLKAGQRAWLRITLLEPALFTAFFQRLFAEGPSLKLRIGGAQFLIESVLGAPGSHPWGGYTTTAALAEEAGSERRVRMQFFSPTAMNRGQEGAARKRMVLLPEPRMVFGSLRGAWNKLVGDDLPFEFERWAEEYVFVREVRSWQTGVYQLKGNVHIGGYGDVTFEALDAEPDWLRILNLLADFAFYSGVGAKTAMGMGQARRVG